MVVKIHSLRGLPLVGGIAVGLAAAAAAEPPASTLRRTQLLEYRDSSGEIQKVVSAAGWGKRRSEIVTATESIMGAFPDAAARVDLAIKVEEEIDVGSYVRRLITFHSEPGSRTPAYLCIPKAVLGKGRHRAAPAVLCLHPTDHQVGHQVVVGLAGRTGRQYASELAERGYVTVAPAYPLMANYHPELEQLGYRSGTMKAIWDNSRCLDLLSSFDFVDSSKGFGAIGHSLGGHNAIFTTVFDRRISVIVTSCGFDSFLDYYGGDEERWLPGKGWCQGRYMPRLAGYRGRLGEIPFDFHELLGAIAPRKVFVSAPRRDSNFRWRSARSCVDSAQRVYELLGADGQLQAVYPDCDHHFPTEIRAQAYAAIAAILKPDSK